MIKKQLYDKCMELLNLQLEKYRNEIKMVKDALESDDTQSEEADTGKSEMLNEIEKYAKYLESTENLKSQLKRVDISQSTETVGNGSLVETENNFFFIAVALGKIDIEDSKNYYSISTEAPIYNMLKGKKAGDSFSFNNLTYRIVNVF
jgi:transcription elongation GreA/GreB family factor